MKLRTHATMIRTAACIALALGATAATPAVAGPMDGADALVQKVRPMAFGDFGARKQLCAVLGIDGSCMDDAASVKDELFEPVLGDPPPLQEMLPVRDPIVENPAPAPQPMVVAVPEPSSMATLLAAALAVVLLSRGRRSTPRA